MKLTIGMPTYNDFHGVYFTVQALRVYQNLPSNTEILVVDNSPGGCKETEKFVKGIGAVYINSGENLGSSTAKNMVFDYATGDYVLCLDCHVLVQPGGIDSLIKWFEADPDSIDLIQGPLWYDPLGDKIHTSFKDEWGSGMWGSWHYDPEIKEGKPFEILMHGTGLMAMRKAAWPGFNKNFKGFGAEEGYIHEKVRQAGGRCICLPDLKWVHRFQRPEGVPYKLNDVERISNYLIAFRELGLDESHVMAHFRGNRQALVNSLNAVNLIIRKPKQPKMMVSAHQKKYNVLGCFYTNNRLSPLILQSSIESIIKAATFKQSWMDIQLRTCSWEPIPDSPIRGYITDQKIPNHLGIALQILKILYTVRAEGFTPDLVCFLEHDVLYNHNHFNRAAIGSVNNPQNYFLVDKDYIGVGEDGYCEPNHQFFPLHQQSVDYQTAIDYLEIKVKELYLGGFKSLEHLTNSDYTVLAPVGKSPNVHINANHHFTNYRDFFHDPYSLSHPYWGSCNQYFTSNGKTLKNVEKESRVKV